MNKGSSIAFAVVALIIGLALGYIIKKAADKSRLEDAKENADAILDEAINQADILKREALFEAKEENIEYRKQIEDELRDRRNEVTRMETRLLQREESLDRKSDNLDQREATLNVNEAEYKIRLQKVEDDELEVSALIEQQKAELERVAMMSREDAQQIIRDEVEQELQHEIAVMVKNAEQKAKDQADAKAKDLLVSAMQKNAVEVVTDTTVTVVSLPNDDMKGRIIGREGRNIKTLESLTGVDLIVDDTPETVVISGFDPIRREIARIALERLIQDGRIHPGRIEEAVDRARRELDEKIRQYGEEALFELGIHDMHPDLIKVIGRLAYRTSYGQNVLKHSIEVGKLAGALAESLGEDVQLAKRAGLMHDFGKALDQEIEGTHVEIGAELAKRYGEDEVVVNSIASHHGDTEPTSVIAELVAIADTLSAARPGARSESMESYIKRLEQLEEISNSYDGVSHSYAIQAGREIRVMVLPDEVDDAQAALLARNIRKRIEEEMNYPGNIKVTVIRETRAVEVAK